MRKVVVIIENGKVKLDFQGFVGNECLQEAERIEQFLASLGVNISDRKIEAKPELYATQTQRQEEKVVT